MRTFSETVRKQKENKNLVIGSDAMFRRVLTIARLKDSNITDVLSYELTSVPLSLFHEDGTMRKNAKSDLKSRLEDHTSILYDTPPNVNSLIIDGMLLVQEIHEAKRTFNEFGHLFLNKILSK